MRKPTTRGALSILLTLCITCQVCAEGKPDGPTLEVHKRTPKLEVRQSQIGFRDTLLFYTFKEQKAVLRLRVDNRDKTFPMTGTVYLFGDRGTEDGIKKWLNNQHSDGLFPEVPEPTSTITLPKGTCRVTSQELIDHSKLQFGEYDNYAVSFEVKDHADKTGLKLKGFKGTTKVHVKTK